MSLWTELPLAGSERNGRKKLKVPADSSQVGYLVIMPNSLLMGVNIKKNLPYMDHDFVTRKL